MAPVMFSDAKRVDDPEVELYELDDNLKRLRVMYEQYFGGTLKREPTELRAKVQRAVTRFVNEPPRNTGHRFKFNQINARFQAYRSHWGRILREMESGLYSPHRFRARLHVQGPEPVAELAETPGPKQRVNPIERLASALSSARSKTGEGGEVSLRQMTEIVRRETDALRARYGDGKVSFKVVVENNRARLKATMTRS